MQAAPVEMVGTDTLWHPMAPICRVKRSSGLSLPGRGLSLRKIVSAAILAKTLPFPAWQLGPDMLQILPQLPSKVVTEKDRNSGDGTFDLAVGNNQVSQIDSAKTNQQNSQLQHCQCH